MTLNRLLHLRYSSRKNGSSQLCLLVISCRSLLSCIVIAWQTNVNMFSCWYWVMSAGYRGKLSRLLRQFTPYVWTEFNWRPTESLTRWFSMLFIIGIVSHSLWCCLLSLYTWSWNRMRMFCIITVVIITEWYSCRVSSNMLLTLCQKLQIIMHSRFECYSFRD